MINMVPVASTIQDQGGIFEDPFQPREVYNGQSFVDCRMRDELIFTELITDETSSEDKVLDC